jgi:hypothetical protein
MTNPNPHNQFNSKTAAAAGKKGKRKGIDERVKNFLEANIDNTDKTREELILEALYKYGVTEGNVKAIEILLDRGFGKPKQSIDTTSTVTVTQPIKIEFED